MPRLGVLTSQTKPTLPGKDGDVVVHVDDHGLRTYESWIFLDGKWLDRTEFKVLHPEAFVSGTESDQSSAARIEARANKFINSF